MDHIAFDYMLLMPACIYINMLRHYGYSSYKLLKFYLILQICERIALALSMVRTYEAVASEYVIFVHKLLGSIESFDKKKLQQ